MKLLLDTQLLLWLAVDPGRVPKIAKEMVEDPDSELLFSAVAIWEVAIKRALNRADFLFDPRALRRNLLESGYAELSVTGEHCIEVTTLAPIHKDPFDRLMLAQARTEGVFLVTTDRVLARYSGPIRLV